MKKVILHVIVLLILAACSTKNISQDKTFTIKTLEGTNQSITVSELKDRSFEFLTKEWRANDVDFSGWKLYEVDKNPATHEITLKYSRGLAPFVFVHFDNYGRAMRWEGYK